MPDRSPAITGKRRRARDSSDPYGASSQSERTPSASTTSPIAQRTPLPRGTEIEVRVDDDGFHGSWFEATVEDFIRGQGRRPPRYNVTYTHLLADDSGSPLVELFSPTHIRPRPPRAESPEPFCLHGIVEAFHNDGWWSGIIFSTDPLTVAFPITREVIKFADPQLVRPRRDYIDGQWIPSQAAITVWPKRKVRVYEVGEKVEVVKDREVFGYSWFPATVAKVIDRLSYIVEYFDLDVDLDEGDGGGKVVEYLHCLFIRPCVEHSPREDEFWLGPGAAVEAYCDGAWSAGIVRRVVGDGEYEVRIDGKGSESEVLQTKLPELLKPHYKWNGKRWRIVSNKRQGNRRQPASGKRQSSPVILETSDDEHVSDIEASVTKRPRKELPQLEGMLTEGCEYASEPETDTTLSALLEPLASIHSPISSVPLPGKNNFNVLSQKIVSTCAVPVKKPLHTFSEHPTPQGESRTNGIDEAFHQEILSDVMHSDGQLNAPVCGTSDEEAQISQEMPLSVQPLQAKQGAEMHSIQALQGKSDASDKSPQLNALACGTSVDEALVTQETPFSTKPLHAIQGGEMHLIQALHGNTDGSYNVKTQVNGNNNIPSKEYICALVASTCNTSIAPVKQIKSSHPVSREAGTESSTKVLTYEIPAKKKGFRESCGLLSSFTTTIPVQQRSRKKVAGRPKNSSVTRQLERGKSQQLDRILEGTMNVNEATNQMLLPAVPPSQLLSPAIPPIFDEATRKELLPAVPPGFETLCNGKGSCEPSDDGVSDINMHSSQLGEELNATIDRICAANEKADVSTKYAATQELTCTSSKICSATESADVFTDNVAIQELTATANRISSTTENASVFTENAASRVTVIDRPVEKSALSFDLPVQQNGGEVDEGSILLRVQNTAGSSQFTLDKTISRSCSTARSTPAPGVSSCEIAGQQVLFVKTSSVWHQIDKMDVFQKIPQRPHFHPLYQYLPALREGMAIGLMVTYANLVESVKNSRIKDSMESFEEMLCTVAHLEENGFTVKYLERSLQKLLQIKSYHAKNLGDKSKLKEQKLGKESAVSRMKALLDEKDKAISQQQDELDRLRCEAEQIAKEKEAENAELSRLDAEDNTLQEACADSEGKFRIVLAGLH